MSSKKPKLGPIVIGVKDIEKAKEFYVNVFEIEVDERSENYLSSHLGNAHIELEEDSKNRFPDWKKNNVGTYKNSEFIVPDMTAFLKKVTQYGGKVVSTPVKRPWGSISAEIADPDGNIFLISQE
jgi:predicted enzyme related to lactoylglutathione lyase